MSISRMSSNYMIDQGALQIQQNLLMMAKVQEQIASGKNMSRPSDDPVGMAQLFKINQELEQNDIYKQNIEAGMAEISAADSAMRGILDIANRARELSIRGANGTNSTESYNAIALEVDSLLNQVLQLGNSTFNGHYIFSGFNTGTAAFSDAGGGLVTYNGTPPTSEFERLIQISRSTYMAINFNGQELLGDVTAAASGPPAVVAGAVGLINSLTKLKLDLQNEDADSVRDDIDLITTDQSTILQFQAELGSRMNQLDLTSNRIEDWNIVQSERYADIQEVNMPKAISQLNFYQTSYEASLGVLSKIMQASLLKFLG